MKISEKQLFLMIRILQAVLQNTRNAQEEKIINDLLNEIHTQQSHDLKEVE